MSVRAYEITLMEYENTPTFNLWHDDELMRLLEPYISEDFTGSGYMEFSTEDLQEALLQARQTNAAKETRSSLLQMIKAAKRSRSGYVNYLCF